MADEKEYERPSELSELNEFMNNWRNHHNDTSLFNNHNIYLMKTVDTDGNITGKAFAINTTSNDYFQAYFAYKTSSLPGASNYNDYRTNGFYIGDGVYAEGEEPLPTQSQLRHEAYSNYATITDSVPTYPSNVVTYWDADNGYLYLERFIVAGYFDYNLSGISGDISITEVGLSPGSVSGTRIMASIALVYNQQGQPEAFVKHPNEKLFVSAYVRTYHKPGYIEEKMRQLGYSFAWNPIGATAFGHTGYYSPSYWTDRGATATATGFDGAILSSSRCYNSYGGYYSGTYVYTGQENTNSERAIYMAKSIGFDSSNQSYDSTNNIATIDNTVDIDSYLMERNDLYFDAVVVRFHPYSGSTNNRSIAYGGLCAMMTEVHLDQPEVITTDVAYSRSINSGDMSAAFGYEQNSNLDVRGLLPITNLNNVTVKAYNGLTHDWDIDMTLQNSVNTANLVMMRMYGWVGMKMYCKYWDGTSELWGVRNIAIYCNMYTQYPITSISTYYSTDIWATDTYWDPNSWERIPNQSNISAQLGTKKYYIGYTQNNNNLLSEYGADSNANVNIFKLTRSGYTVPTIVSDDVVTITQSDDLDPVDTSMNPPYSYYSYFTECFISNRRHITDDTNGYIWMSHFVYYPEADNGNGYKIRITTKDPVGNVHDPIPSLRFTEPSGKRILQVFRKSSNDSYMVLNRASVSVFDVPSSTDIDNAINNNDPITDLSAYEYAVPISDTFVDIYSDIRSTYGDLISSTETGYVIFTNSDNSRSYIVNMLGDAGSNYEPYSFTLKYPSDNTEVETYQCYAIKNTSMIVFLDPRTTTSSEFGFMILDLATNTVVDQFTVPSTYWYGLFYITAVNDKLFLVGNRSSDKRTSEYYTYLYDLSKAPGSRFIETNWSTELGLAIVPNGDRITRQYDNNGQQPFSWLNLVDPHIYGDNECILGQAKYSDSPYTVKLYYFNLNDPLNPINFTANVGINTNDLARDSWFIRLEMDLFTYNSGKQRTIGVFRPSENSDTDLQAWFFDANVIRDKHAGPKQINATTASFPRTLWHNESYSSTSAIPYMTACMYKEKLFVSEYSTNYSYREISWHNYQYTQLSNNTHRWIDLKRVSQYRMSGETTTIQAYNNPRRIYFSPGYQIKFINSADIWDPSDIQ